jgi:thiosulfate/3-mercaptopyruvate sulfurtransferase
MTVSGYAKDDVLVSADWARAHLDDPSVRFVEVDVDTTAYDQSHIPGAVGWNWTSQLADGLRRDIATREEFSALLNKSGIGPDTTVVLYGDNNNWFAAWAYWQLHLYGHTNTRLINGGRKFWLDNNLPLSTDVPDYPETGYSLPEADFSLRAFRDDILPRIGDGDLTLVDVRSPAEFNGEVIAPPGMTETAQRAGHIPGAASIPWAQQVREDGTFKSAEELTALYAAKGVEADDDVIAYCRIGERSSLSWFVLHELLGFARVRNYDGSWTEWGSMVGVPIEVNQPVAVA